MNVIELHYKKYDNGNVSPEKIVIDGSTFEAREEPDDEGRLINYKEIFSREDVEVEKGDMVKVYFNGELDYVAGYLGLKPDSDNPKVNGILLEQ